jgi:FtsP/CotA-like multicopper oxidase with cupredoxin domain
MTMTTRTAPATRRWIRRHPWRTLLIGVLALILGAGGTFAWQLRTSALPERLNMGTASTAHHHDGGTISTGTSPGASAPAVSTTGSVTSVTDLVAAPSDAPTKSFHLTAQAVTLDLGGQTVDAWTFDGTAPGPELRVQQGDQVVVQVTNQLPVGVTIHWHGVTVPNAADGVAGLTQDAIRPGESYTYRFVASEVGTFWYHTHQEASIGVPRGLYGALIVEPKAPPVRYDRDYTVVLHEWTLPRWWLPRCHPPFPACPTILDVDGHRDGVQLEARPGERVRLRILDAGEHQHLPALVGVPFRVVALDGHDVHEPQELRGVRLPLGAAQRYDLDFMMPNGPVALIDADPRANPVGQRPAVTLGTGPNDREAGLTLAYPGDAPLFDFASYGTPAPAPIDWDTPVDAEYSLDLGSYLGFYDGEYTRQFTINGAVFPAIPEILVRPGEVVKIHFSDTGDSTGQGHPMHLHGHTFTVLAKNGQPLLGSPVQLDTVMVGPGETYDVAFRANNPGLWMLHCHIGSHASKGMDTMVVYPGISTPFDLGRATGNLPE